MSQMMSPKKFVENFAPALEEYLEYQYRQEGHILDMCAAAGEYFTVSYTSIDAALAAVEYTEPAATKSAKTKK